MSSYSQLHPDQALHTSSNNSADYTSDNKQPSYPLQNEPKQTRTDIYGFPIPHPQQTNNTNSSSPPFERGMGDSTKGVSSSETSPQTLSSADSTSATPKTSQKYKPPHIRMKEAAMNANSGGGGTPDYPFQSANNSTHISNRGDNNSGLISRNYNNYNNTSNQQQNNRPTKSGGQYSNYGIGSRAGGGSYNNTHSSMSNNSNNHYNNHQGSNASFQHNNTSQYNQPSSGYYSSDNQNPTGSLYNRVRQLDSSPNYNNNEAGGGNFSQYSNNPPNPVHDNTLSHSHQQNNHAHSSFNAPKSVNKIGWDVRNGRRYYPENELDIFDSSSKVHTGINFDSYDDIPVEITGSGVDKLPPIESFQSTRGIHELLAKNVNRVNYSRPTPVQKHAIPVIMNGRDLMACAQTGSGKTAAFLFPIISTMLNMGPPPNHQPTRTYLARREPALPVCLVLSPTRELTLQIYNEARKFAYRTGIRTCVVYGGNDVKVQVNDLEKGCDICVATPGRLRDLMDRTKVNLECVQHLVLDEADRMLDMGFYPQMKEIVLDSKMPHSQQGRQTVMFSATFPREVQQLAKEFLMNYVFLSVGRVGSTNTFILQKLQYVLEDQKSVFLMKLLRESPQGLILIFVETKRKADHIEGLLIDNHFKAVSIHGDKTQYEREDALRYFKDGSCRIMVATDVAARGLDIPNISHVINFDIPNNVDDYVHRIGRTGRAGNKGLATSFVNESNWPVFKDLINILHESQQEIPSWFQSLVSELSFGKGRGGANRFGTNNNIRINVRSNNATKDYRAGNDQVQYTYSKGGSTVQSKGNTSESIKSINSSDRNTNAFGWKGQFNDRSRAYDNDMNGRDDAW